MRKIKFGFLFLLGNGLGSWGAVFTNLSMAAGALLMDSGIQELHGESPFLLRISKYLKMFTGLMLFRVLCILLDINFDLLVNFMRMIQIMFPFFVSYWMITGVKEIEQRRKMDLKSKSMVKTWRVFALTGIYGIVSAFLLKYIPDQVPEGIVMTGPVSLVVCIFSYFIYILWVYNACALYDGDVPAEEEAPPKKEHKKGSGTNSKKKKKKKK